MGPWNQRTQMSPEATCGWWKDKLPSESPWWWGQLSLPHSQWLGICSGSLACAVLLGLARACRGGCRTGVLIRRGDDGELLGLIRKSGVCSVS